MPKKKTPPKKSAPKESNSEEESTKQPALQTQIDALDKRLKKLGAK